MRCDDELLLPQLGSTFKQSLQLHCLRTYCVAMYSLKMTRVALKNVFALCKHREVCELLCWQCSVRNLTLCISKDAAKRCSTKLSVVHLI